MTGSGGKCAVMILLTGGEISNALFLHYWKNYRFGTKAYIPLLSDWSLAHTWVVKIIHGSIVEAREFMSHGPLQTSLVKKHLQLMVVPVSTV